MKKNARNQSLRQETLPRYEMLEARQVLASIFPTYIGGEFTFGNGPDAATPYALADTFELETNPTATKTIYLDFDGHHSVNNQWGHDIVFPAFDRDGNTAAFSDAELLEIQLQFQNVAEDFIGFNVNVTTKEPAVDRLINSGNGDEYYGVRAINTQATDGFGNGIGGVAYLNSFDNGRDDPVFTFNKGANNGAMTNSHEVGHALGLGHDGLGSNTYHRGTGSGDTSWGPIMGAPFGKHVTQWSNGDYADSTNTQDDYAIITKSANGFGFRPDQVGDTIAAAAPITPATDGSVFAWNIIEQNSDVDVYSFETGGAVQLNINAFQEYANLDVLAKIYDATGVVVAEDNPIDGVNAGFDLTLEPGQYYLSIEGVGKAGVYSDYGSIGFFTIDGTIEEYDSGTGDPVEIGESGTVRIRHQWVTVNLDNTYSNPVVVAGPASRAGGDPLSIRVRNVTGTSFEIALDEWDYRDGRHVWENVSYMVVEAGTHTLTDGTVLVAGNMDGQTHRWKSYDLGGTFDTRPVVISQIVTDNEMDSATTRMRFQSDNSFQIKIREQEANQNRHAAETVGFIAIETGAGATGDQLFEAFATPDQVTHRNYSLSFQSEFATAPSFFANMQTHDGGDTTTVRYRTLNGDSATIFLEEEKSRDSEIAHTTEVVGFLAIEQGDILAVAPAEGGGGGQSIMANDGDDGNRMASNEFFTEEQDDPKLWEAVRVLDSWGETAFSINHHDVQGNDNDGLEPCCCTSCITGTMASVVDNDETLELSFAQGQLESGAGNSDDIDSSNSFAIVDSSEPLQLAGAVQELSPTGHTDDSYRIGDSSRNGESRSIEDAEISANV